MNRDLETREAALEMGADEFRKLGHQLVDQLATFLETLPSRAIHPDETVGEVRAALGAGGLPEHGSPAGEILDEAAGLVFDHSLHNGHPGFMAYVTSSAAPVGVLGDFLAASVNANVGAWALSPMASEIETQTIQWIREAIGCPEGYGGLLVSGGNMANFVGFLAARKAKAGWDIRAKGSQSGERRLRLYASQETHTWVQKAADLFGLGTDAISWISTDKDQKLDVAELEQKILADRARGYQPFFVVGSAGTVSTGAIDPLAEIAGICRRHDLWFHVDGAYGAFAAMLPEATADLRALAEADSIALDPHKWLYAPLEAGCALVRDPQSLVDAFSFHPEYYLFDQEEDQIDPNEPPAFNYYELGPQNSRGFRALKVWLAWRQAGREGYIRMIRDDIALAEALYACVRDHPDLEAFTQSLSITTFRYVPKTIPDGTEDRDEWLNEVNRGVLKQLQSGKKVYLSNAVVDGCFVMRACIVNFRTTLAEIEALTEMVAATGREWLAARQLSSRAPS